MRLTATATASRRSRPPRRSRGWRRGRPDDELTLAPQSDGGPGFVGVLAGRVGEVKTLRVSGPLTDEVSADWVLDPAPPRTAYIECAQACGLALLGGPPTVQTALAAHSRGVGQLIAGQLRPANLLTAPPSFGGRHRGGCDRAPLTVR